MDGLVDHLAEALEAVDHLVAGVDDRQWSGSTPCPGWTVHDLVEHVVAGHRTAAALVRGEPPPGPRTDGPDADLLGTFRAGAYDVLAAFGEPCVLTMSFTVPRGSQSGIAALRGQLVEALVHGWDLARATGQTIRVRDRIVELALDVGDQKPTGTGDPFAPPQPVAVNAPVLDRLSALLGRRTESTPTGSAPCRSSSTLWGR